jgi:UDP-N-acetylmuramate dehydrogenase
MNLLTHFDLTAFNTLGLRSQADLYAEIHNVAELKQALRDAQLKKLPLKILGGGSNLVLPSDVAGLTIRIVNKGRNVVSEDTESRFITCAAGEVWHEFVQWTLAQGYSGLENLSLIPGTVGASPIQNIGAYGVEVKDSLHEVTCLDLTDGSFKKFSNADCRFSYRDSFFKQEGAGKYLIWDVTFRLPKKEKLHLEYGDIRKEVERQQLPLNAQSVSKAVIAIRQSKLPDPAQIGNAGSFFKNPIVSPEKRNQLLQEFPQLVSFTFGSNFKLAAGWLIDQTGWKGRKLGPVGMYEKQALVLVNHGGAAANDVWKLADTVTQDVLKKFGVHLESEPVRW